MNWIADWDGLSPLEAARRSRDADLEHDARQRQSDRYFNDVVEWLESQHIRHDHTA